MAINDIIVTRVLSFCGVQVDKENIQTHYPNELLRRITRTRRVTTGRQLQFRRLAMSGTIS